MFKSAQTIQEDFVVVLPEQKEDDEFVVEMDPTNDSDIELIDLPMGDEVEFKLSFLPGAPDEEVELKNELEVEKGDKDSEKSKEKSEAKSDKDWQSLPKKEFLKWFKEYLNKIPKHKGETIALERALSYLKRGLDILSKSVQQDFDGEIDISKAEDARFEVESGIDRLDGELQKRRKKAFKSSNEITKEAQKTPGVGGIIVTVPLLVSSIARTCINSTISGGKDLEHVFKRLAEKYKLSDREKLEVVQLLNDMNFPIRRDNGFMVDDKEEYGYSSENNYNHVPNYQA